MYHRRKRSRRRSLSPALYFYGGASSSFSTSDASPPVGVAIKNSRQLSSDKFLSISSAVAHDIESSQNSQENIKKEQTPCLSLSCVTSDMSLYTSFETGAISAKPWRNSVARKRCRSLSTLRENLHLYPEDADLMEDSFKNKSANSSVKKEHLLTYFRESALLAQGDRNKYSLMKNDSDDKVITRWDMFSDFPSDSEQTNKKDEIDVTSSRQIKVLEEETHSETSSELCGEITQVRHTGEPAEISTGSCRKRVSQTVFHCDGTSGNTVDKKELNPTRNGYPKKRKGKIANLEADESGVLKKRYEVEEIIDHCTSKNKRYYYVKWRGWSHSDNTWEPEEHLKTCKSVLKSYIQFLRERISSGNLYSTQEAKDMQEKLVDVSKTELEKMMKLYVKCNGVSYTVCSEDEIVHKMKTVLRALKIRREKKNIEKIKNDILIRAYDIYRMVQLDALETWEKELNSKATEKAKILVENNVDLEGPPSNFTYINDYIPGKGVFIPDEPPIGCTCGPKCDRYSKECCGTQSGSTFAYSFKRLLVVDVGVPIYECNKRCKCTEECSNRVVQRGRKIDLSIFRTSTGCGWGVKTLQRIKKGSFICEYVGEVIKTKEAERRGKIYDAEGRTYLFDLDFNVDACPYTVDAALYGNVSHFINHSCSPNVAVYAVWVNCLDPNLPKLALFAKKDIEIGEELTFDYMHNNLSIQNDMRSVTNQVASSPRSRLVLPNADDPPDFTSSKTPCRCGAQQCKRYLF